MIQTVCSRNIQKEKHIAPSAKIVKTKIETVAQERLKNLDSYNRWFKPTTYTFAGIEFSASLASIGICASAIAAGATGAGLALSISFLVIGILWNWGISAETWNTTSIDDLEKEMRTCIKTKDKTNFLKALSQLEMMKKNSFLSFYAYRKATLLIRMGTICLSENVAWN